MTRQTRLLLVVAACAVALAIVLPLWEVRLGAPQYPEGLGLRIMSHTVRGLGPHDLQNINGLNHYIGMKPIVPESIPELRYMPWILAGLAAALAVVAWRGSRRLLLAWLVVMVVAGAVGIWDFWRWEYDYGHNLDIASAAIVVPGMSYQPPLIGRKYLLNFVATAWPGTGAMALGVAWLLAALAWWRTGRRHRAPVATVAAAAVALGACTSGPPEIAFDLDECRFCRMIISDERFAAAATTATGRTVRFDSIECLAGWVAAESEPPRAIWVTDIARPGTLIPAAEAVFRRDTAVASPMGAGWLAEVAAAGTAPGIGWDSLVAVVRAEGAVPAGAHGAH